MLLQIDYVFLDVRERFEFALRCSRPRPRKLTELCARRWLSTKANERGREGNEKDIRGWATGISGQVPDDVLEMLTLADAAI